MFSPKMSGPLRKSLLVALPLLALACLAPRAEAASGQISVESGGIKRTAAIVQNERLKKSRRAAFIVLRSGEGNLARIRGTLGLADAARFAGTVLVYPDAMDRKWSVEGATPRDDVAFVRALAEKLVADGTADRKRIFLVGISSGGMLAMRLACENADLFAGAAAIISNMPTALAGTCKPSKPLPFLLVNGTANPVIPFGGGKANVQGQSIDVASTDATLAVFGKANGCGEARTKTELPDRDRNDGSRVILERLQGCKEPVALYRVDGGGHTIPGTRSNLDRGTAVGARNRDFSAGRAIFDFLVKRGG